MNNTINFTVKNQELRTDCIQPLPVGTANFVVAHFDFIDDWGELFKVATFKNITSGVSKAVLLSYTDGMFTALYPSLASEVTVRKNECLVPVEVLANAGNINISLKGVNGTLDEEDNVVTYKSTIIARAREMESDIIAVENTIADVPESDITEATTLTLQEQCLAALTYYKEQSCAYDYCGQLDSIDNLPTSAKNGDIYNIDGYNYCWNEKTSNWDNLSGIASLTSLFPALNDGEIITYSDTNGVPTSSGKKIETTLTNDSTKIPTSSAVKAYVDDNSNTNTESQINDESESNSTAYSSAKTNQLYVDKTKLQELVKNDVAEDMSAWSVIQPLYTYLDAGHFDVLGTDKSIIYTQITKDTILHYETATRGILIGFPQLAVCDSIPASGKNYTTICLNSQTKKNGSFNLTEGQYLCYFSPYEDATLPDVYFSHYEYFDVANKDYVSEKIDGINEKTKNLFNPNTIIADSYINAGIVGSNSNSWCCSDYIEVTSGLDYVFSSNMALYPFSRMTNTCFYDENKSYLSNATSNPFTVPENAVYVRLNIQDPPKVDSCYMLEKGSEIGYYIPYGYTKDYKRLLASPLLNFKYGHMGDSISALGFPLYIAKYSGMIYQNNTIGGTQVGMLNASDTNAMCGDRATQFDADTNVVAIMAGSNDWSGQRTIGSIDDVAIGDTTTFVCTGDKTHDTFYACYQLMINKIMATCPQAQIILCEMPYRKYEETASTIPMQSYRDAVIAIAKKYHLPVAKTYSEAGMFEYNAPTYLGYRTKTNSDGSTEQVEEVVHFNSKGQQRLGKILYGEIMKTCAFDAKEAFINTTEYSKTTTNSDGSSTSVVTNWGETL